MTFSQLPLGINNTPSPTKPQKKPVHFIWTRYLIAKNHDAIYIKLIKSWLEQRSVMGSYEIFYAIA